MPLEVFLALRYLRAGRRYSFISLITLLSVAGVALGVCALIVVLSVMNGFEKEVKEKILGQTAHITVYHARGGLDDPDKVMAAARADKEVKAAAPFVYGQVMLVARSGAGGAVLRGIDIPASFSVIDLKRTMVKGSAEDLAKPGPRGLPGLVVGKALSRRLGLGLGTVVNLVNPVGEDSPVGRVPKSEPFRVVGIFESGLYQYDSTVVYTSLEAARELMDMPSGVTGVEITLNDIYAAPRVALDLTRSLGPLYYTQDWMSLNHSLFSALALEKTAMFIILILIVLVAAFGIVSSLIMLVIEKTRDIGILKAMGANRAMVQRVFMLMGVVIGAMGTILGLLGGLGLCAALARYKFIELPSDVYPISTLPVDVEPLMVALVAVSALAIALLATVYPARAAGKLDPVQALRYE